MSAVIVDQLYKSYGKTRALNGVSFSVDEGELYGIIGPDGAGKSTLFRVLTTLMLADKGDARVMGYDVVKDYRKIRDIIGFATVFNTTIEENYHLIADIYKQIEPFKHRKAGKLSGGMKQKLALSCALIHKPKVLFLDEPTTGVDPVSRKEFWGMLLKLKRQGITILVSTPYMDEASLCDRIALVQAGEFLQVDTPRSVVSRYPATLLAVRSGKMHQLLGDLRDYPYVNTSFSFGTAFHVTLREGGSPEALREYLAGKGHTDVEARAISPTVEDCFMLLSHRTQRRGDTEE